MYLLKEQLLTILISFSVTMIGYAQLVILETEMIEGERIQMKIVIENQGAEVESFHWDIDRNDNFPDEWEIQVYDCFTCFQWGIETNDCEYACSLDPGEKANFLLSIDPNNVDSTGDLTFKLLQECGIDSTLLAVGNLNFVLTEPTSTTTLDNSSILVFPNPANSSFGISDDGNLSRIEIYDNRGKEVHVDFHMTEQLHGIAHLEKGIYFVRILDEKNEVVKVVRLTKE